MKTRKQIIDQGHTHPMILASSLTSNAHRAITRLIAAFLLLALVLNFTQQAAVAQTSAARSPQNIALLDKLLAQVKVGQETVPMDDMLFKVKTLKAYRDSLVSDISSQSTFGTTRYWPGGVVPYAFDASVTATQRTAFESACDEWEAAANLKFVLRTDQVNYISVYTSTVNNSYVGMIGGAQRLNMADWGWKFIICHELGHALGLYHEHQRSDRDSYVDIVWTNITTGTESNFSILDTSINKGSYDFDSVMHYYLTAFSSNGGNTIQPKVSYTGVIGHSDHLSGADKAGMAAIYGAPGTTGTGPTSPANDNLANAAPVTGSTGSTSGTNVYATEQAGEPGLEESSASVWYKWTAPAAGNATFDTFGSNFDTVLAVYTSSATPPTMTSLSLVPNGSNDQANGTDQSQVQVAVAAGVTYYLQVSGWSALTGSIKLNWSLQSTTPTTSISGYVRTPGNVGMSGVIIKRTGGDSAEVTSTTTDASGFYSFSSVPISTLAYRITPTKSGYYFSPASAGVKVTSTSLNPKANFTALQWKATDVAVDGTNETRVLLTRSTGAARIVRIGTTGLVEATTDLPLTSGWLTRGMAVGADGNSRVLWWSKSLRQFSLSWYDVNGTFIKSQVVDLRNYSNSAGTLGTAWEPVNLVTRADNKSVVMLKRMVSISGVSTPAQQLLVVDTAIPAVVTVGAYQVVHASTQPIAIGAGTTDVSRGLWWNKSTRLSDFGVYSATGAFQTWQRVDSSALATGYLPLDSVTGADNKSRILFGKGGSVQLWQVDTSDATLNTVPVNFNLTVAASGFTPLRVGVGADHKARILWSHTNGSYRLSVVTNTGVNETNYTFAPAN